MQAPLFLHQNNSVTRKAITKVFIAFMISMLMLTQCNANANSELQQSNYLGYNFLLCSSQTCAHHYIIRSTQRGYGLSSVKILDIKLNTKFIALHWIHLKLMMNKYIAWIVCSNNKLSNLMWIFFMNQLKSTKLNETEWNTNNTAMTH